MWISWTFLSYLRVNFLFMLKVTCELEHVTRPLNVMQHEHFKLEQRDVDVSWCRVMLGNESFEDTWNGRNAQFLHVSSIFLSFFESELIEGKWKKWGCWWKFHSTFSSWKIMTTTNLNLIQHPSKDFHSNISTDSSSCQRLFQIHIPQFISNRPLELSWREKV